MPRQNCSIGGRFYNLTRDKICTFFFLQMAVTGQAMEGDWPTARLNPQRNAFSNQQVQASQLEKTWVYRSSNPPRPAWHGPAKWDAYGDVRMHSMRSYDEVFHVIGVGSHIYFGSSVDDTVTCLDASSGLEKWTFFTDGPVRIAPTFHSGKLYFGSDDGYAYCVNADSGEQVWKFRPLEPDRLVINNGRFIPQLPVRSGVVVDEGVAYFAASLLPWEKSYLCAVDAESGRSEGDGCYVRALENMTFEGPLAVSPRLVIAPQGRVPPVLFSRRTGKSHGALDGGGGSFVVVLPNREVAHGPGNKAGWVNFSNADSREKLATHNSARALALDNHRTYILTKTSLGAVDSETKQEVWRVPCTEGLALIGVGNTLFVGKPDRVEAYKTEDGQLMWQADVEGKAFGLSFAQSKLLVSTDLGVISAFSPTAQTALSQPETDTGNNSPKLDESQLAPVGRDVGPNLLGRWVFHPSLLDGLSLKNLAGGLPASIDGFLRPTQVGRYAALAMSDGDNSVTISEDLAGAKLPQREMTASGWVRIDKPQSWGGIVGALQDNGDYERGWLLGYRDSKFCIALASAEGQGRITYLTANSEFTVGAWHHVAATYDGGTLQLFVDGKLAASSSEQKGAIRYADEGPYVIGAYRDKDEYFPLTGMIHEVRVYERALTARELRKHYRQKAKQFPPPLPPVQKPKTFDVAVGPWLQFTEPGVAVIRWKTNTPTDTKLTYRLDDQTELIHDAKKKTEHEVRLSGLERNRLYHYAIAFTRDEKTVNTPEYECDTFFNYTISPVENSSGGHERDDPTNIQYRQAASAILKQAELDHGMCLDWDSGSCRLAEELIRQSNLRVLCVCRDKALAEAARLRFRSAGWYGNRIVVRHAANLDDLKLTPHWANLMVSGGTLIEGTPPVTLPQVRQVLAPTGKAIFGAIVAGEQPTGKSSPLNAWVDEENVAQELAEDSLGQWVTISGKPFAGAGEWPYIYGGAHNSAYGGESLGGAKTSEDLEVQWLGRPGPRYQADRSGRKTPPISFGGRLFLEGLHRIVALDSYNGTVLWSLEIPHFERFNIPRDTANWCGEGDSLFAAVRDRCWRIDTTDGQITQMYALPEAERGKGEFDWGYVASVGELLIGSAVKRGNFYTDFWGGPGWYDAETGPETFKICSDAIFGFDKQTGKRRWQHSQGLIINSTITMSDQRLFFVEGRNKSLLSEDSRRLNSPNLWTEQYLVAIDIETGQVDWEVPLDTVDGTVVFFMAHSAETLVIVSSTAGEFHVYAIKDNSGSPLWNVAVPWGRDGKADHGSHMSRPAIVGNRLFVRPSVIDLTTGEIRDERIPEGKCGTYACTDYALFYRGDPGHRFAMWSSTDNQYSQWIRLRPDCWLSSIPAGGMLLSPEGGGGCSCGSWMETSIGFIPVARLSQ